MPRSIRLDGLIPDLRAIFTEALIGNVVKRRRSQNVFNPTHTSQSGPHLTG